MDYCTYKFYDEKGRRLAIFAKKIGDSLQIYVVTCSKQDKFTKKKALLIYNGRDRGDSMKGYFVADVVEGKPKKSFIVWCNTNFYKKEKVSFVFEGYVLAKGDDVLPGITPCSPINTLGEVMEGVQIVEKEVASGV